MRPPMTTTTLFLKETALRGQDIAAVCGNLGLTMEQALGALRGERRLPPAVIRDLRETLGVPEAGLLSN